MEFHYTYRDYREWPDDERWELIDGVAYNMRPAPRTGHQDIAGNPTASSASRSPLSSV